MAGPIFDGEALENQSSAPHSKPRKTPPETEALIVDYRREHPAIGAVKIRKILENKEESFNRSMTKELLKHATITDFSDAQRQFDTYRAFYNNERPHHSLNLEVPSKKYTRSPRLYSERISQWEYPPERQIRRVKETGHFNWEGQGYFLSEAFGGKEIAVRESRVEGCVSLFFRQFRTARIEVEKRVYVFRRMYLIEGDPRLKDKL